MPEPRHYIYVINPARATFPGDATAEEMAIVGEHFAYLQASHAEGRVLFVGRCDDAEFGIAVFSAASDEDAQRFLDEDPAVKAGVFKGRVKHFLVALK